MKEKRRLFKIYDKSRRETGNLEIEAKKRNYEVAKRAAKRGIRHRSRAGKVW